MKKIEKNERRRIDEMKVRVVKSAIEDSNMILLTNDCDNVDDANGDETGIDDSSTMARLMRLGRR